MIMQFFRLVTFSLLILLLAINDNNAQNSQFLNGYNEKISGDEISYHAPDPRAHKALLIRSQDSTNVIQWKSSIVPESFDQQKISFVWMFGMDASSDQHNFILSADGKDMVEFSNPLMAEKNDVRIKGKGGSTLRLRVTKIDRNKDVMGYAIFTMPANLIKAGKPVLFQARGESAGSDIWYMTFKYPIENELSIRSQPILNNRKDKNLQAVLAYAYYFFCANKGKYGLATTYKNRGRSCYYKDLQIKTCETMDDLFCSAYTYRYRIYTSPK